MMVHDDDDVVIGSSERPSQTSDANFDRACLPLGGVATATLCESPLHTQSKMTKPIVIS